MKALDSAYLRDVTIFRAIVKSGGFAPAQIVLNISLSSISVHMKALEQRLGMTLCERGRKGFSLTPHGHTFYQASKELFAAIDTFNATTNDISDELEGDVYIGLQDNLATNDDFKLSAAIAKFNQRKNTVTINLAEATAEEQLSRVLEGRYNLGVGIFNQRHPDIEYQSLLDESLMLYCAQNHPLFEKPNVTVSEINKARFCGLATPKPTLENPKILRQEPSAIVETMDATVLMLLSGEFIGLLPTHFARSWEQRGLVRPLLPKESLGVVEVSLISKKGIHVPHGVEVFREDLLSVHDHLVTQ